MRIAVLLCVAAMAVCSEGADQSLAVWSTSTLSKAETGTNTPKQWEGEYTTDRGKKSSAGSKCTSECFNTAPPSADGLGRATGSWWCFTDNEANRPDKRRSWGECGGCRPAIKKCGKCCTLYGDHHGLCTGLETDRAQYRRVWNQVVDAKFHSPNSQCDARVDPVVNNLPGSKEVKKQKNICGVRCRTCGEETGMCTSCREDASPVDVFPNSGNFRFNCFDTGTQNQMECAPSQVMRPGKPTGNYLCLKSGVVTFPVFHPGRFSGNGGWKGQPVHLQPFFKGNCGNWWAAKCRAAKFVRCTNKNKATKCRVLKEARCEEVCQGYDTGNANCASQGPDMRSATGKSVLDAAFTRQGKKCFPGCLDPSRTDGKIKANGYFKGEDSNGVLLAPSDWCREQATGY